MTDSASTIHTLILQTGVVGLHDADAINITLLSASTVIGKLLAPTPAMLKDYHDGKIGAEAYEGAYIRLMRRRYDSNPVAFRELLKRDRVVFLCYCEPGAFCHRHIAVKIFTTIVERLNQKANQVSTVVENRGEVELPKQMDLFNQEG